MLQEKEGEKVRAREKERESERERKEREREREREKEREAHAPRTLFQACGTRMVDSALMNLDPYFWIGVGQRSILAPLKFD